MMRKIIIMLMILLATSTATFAARIPKDIQGYVENTFPKTNFRFDGVIILPDATTYLPLFPAEELDVEKLEIKRTYPENKTLDNKPEIVIFNNFKRNINSQIQKKATQKQKL